MQLWIILNFKQNLYSFSEYEYLKDYNFATVSLEPNSDTLISHGHTTAMSHHSVF